MAKLKDFEVIDKNTLTKLESSRRRRASNQMSPLNRRIVDQFDSVKPDEAFPVTVPSAESDSNKFAKRVAALLSNQGKKNRVVFVNPEDEKVIIIKKTEPAVAA